MPSSRPLVTTVIPTYRRPQLLHRAIVSALNQSWPDGRVAVFDDASGDETEAVVHELAARDSRVTYHRNETNLGLTGNFRFALERVETPYFSILSNDDMLLPHMYEAGLSALESHPEAAFAATQVIHVDDRERVLRLHFPWHPGVYTPPDGLLKLIAWGAPAWAGIIFRSSLLTELGNLDPQTDTLIDYDFQVRIAARKPYVVDPTPGAVFFHRRASISGEARLGGTWPGWLRMMENLAKDESVPPEAREEAGAILKQQLIRRLYGVGVVSSRHANYSDARQAADLLSSRYGEHSKARRVRRFASTYERIPLLGRAHTKYSEWRQPYERVGWRRTRVTLARRLSADRQSSSEPRRAGAALRMGLTDRSPSPPALSGHGGRPTILHILHSSAIGGGPNSVRMLALGMRESFYPIVVSSGEGELPAQLAARGVEFHALPLATKRSFLASTWRLAGLIRKIGPQAIHLHGHFAGSVGQLAVFLAGRPPTVYSVRWPAYHSDKNSYTRVRNWLVERFSCAAATVVVAISEHDRMTLVRRRLCNPGKLKMIHNAFAVLPPEPSADNPMSDVVTIGFVGRLVDQKGCDELISALAVLVAEGAPVRLIVVGDGPLRAGLEAGVVDRGLVRHVEFLGFRADASELMATMDIVAVPSLFEPFGIVAVEAMAQARPVVASAVGGLTETVEDGVTGLLVPPGDPQKLAHTLGQLVRSSAMRAQMGQAARQRALDLFSPERTIAAYSQIYTELTARRNPSAQPVSDEAP